MPSSGHTFKMTFDFSQLPTIENREFLCCFNLSKNIMALKLFVIHFGVSLHSHPSSPTLLSFPSPYFSSPFPILPLHSSNVVWGLSWPSWLTPSRGGGSNTRLHGMTVPINMQINTHSRYKTWKLPWTHLKNVSPSCNVSGRGFPRVSGSKSNKRPPKIAEEPKMSRGKGFQTSSRFKMNGHIILATLELIEHIPTPVALRYNGRSNLYRSISQNSVLCIHRKH